MVQPLGQIKVVFLFTTRSLQLHHGATMSQEVRIDKPLRVNYPSAPDARGSARVNYLRRPYYLGPHDSPLSYVMFGLWKQRLEETGEPPTSKEIRPLAEEILSARDTVPRVSLWRTAAVVSLVVLLCTSVTALVNFRSTEIPPVVDGMELSEREFDFVRGMRLAEDRRVAAKPEVTRMVSVADELFRQFDEGKIIEPFHQRLRDR